MSLLTASINRIFSSLSECFFVGTSCNCSLWKATKVTREKSCCHYTKYWRTSQESWLWEHLWITW